MVVFIYFSVTHTTNKSYRTSCTYLRLWWILLVPGDRCLVARSSAWGPWSSLWNIFVFLWGCRASARLLPHLWTDLKGKGHWSVWSTDGQTPLLLRTEKANGGTHSSRCIPMLWKTVSPQAGALVLRTASQKRSWKTLYFTSQTYMNRDKHF